MWMTGESRSKGIDSHYRRSTLRNGSLTTDCSKRCNDEARARQFTASVERGRSCSPRPATSADGKYEVEKLAAHWAVMNASGRELQPYMYQKTNDFRKMTSQEDNVGPMRDNKRELHHSEDPEMLVSANGDVSQPHNRELQPYMYTNQDGPAGSRKSKRFIGEEGTESVFSTTQGNNVAGIASGCPARADWPEPLDARSTRLSAWPPYLTIAAWSIRRQESKGNITMYGELIRPACVELVPTTHVLRVSSPCARMESHMVRSLRVVGGGAGARIMQMSEAGCSAQGILDVLLRDHAGEVMRDDGLDWVTSDVTDTIVHCKALGLDGSMRLEADSWTCPVDMKTPLLTGGMRGSKGPGTEKRGV